MPFVTSQNPDFQNCVQREAIKKSKGWAFGISGHLIDRKETHIVDRKYNVVKLILHNMGPLSLNFLLRSS